ncbi:MAG TPA: hypothetical protein VN176_13205 [Verrucomicrobiae bacterium]|jgi:hypothetical protein|nr:hypothetical protein [Verrucomicrobiae bacterium]
MMSETFDTWLTHARAALDAINMPMDKWQQAWAFDFAAEYSAGTDPRLAADKANRFWWRNQNLAIRQACTLTSDCWLPRDHQGKCEPVL